MAHRVAVTAWLVPNSTPGKDPDRKGRPPRRAISTGARARQRDGEPDAFRGGRSSSRRRRSSSWRRPGISIPDRRMARCTLRRRASATATFVGSETCAGCHRAEAELWRGSQHKHAMEHATDKSVLGDFNDASFDYYGVHSRFFRKDGKFLVETDGPDGKLATFEVKYTFGVDPLQQYLIEFPDGRLQALSIAWDSRPKDEGGQRWFHLYPGRGDQARRRPALDQAEPELELHVRRVPLDRRAQELRCGRTTASPRAWRRSASAARPVTARARDTSPGRARSKAGGRSARAKTRARGCSFGSTSGATSSGRSIRRPATRGATSRRPLLRKEVETCGLCHARRGAFSEDWVPGRSLSDTHVVSPLARGLYHADGQMLDEVYNYGSFKQSKMFAAGVTCSDCHEPHGAKLRAPGDGVCLQCHAADKYAAVAHHRHAAASPAPACASCHMPARTYMVVDRRHDHSFRVPRPDLSVKLGTPNACNDCHRDKSAEWAAAAIEALAWTEPQGLPDLRRGVPCGVGGPGRCGRAACCRGVGSQCAGHRARSALSELGARLSPANLDLAQAVASRIPIRWCGSARSTCSRASPAASFGRSSRRCCPIRIAACASGRPRCWRRFRPRSQPAADRERFERAASEFIAAQRLNADRPEARSALGQLPTHGVAVCRGRGRIQGRAAAQPAICAGGDQPRRSLSAARAGRRWRERAARGDRRVAARRGAASCARPRR